MTAFHIEGSSSYSLTFCYRTAILHPCYSLVAVRVLTVMDIHSGIHNSRCCLLKNLRSKKVDHHIKSAKMLLIDKFALILPSTISHTISLTIKCRVWPCSLFIILCSWKILRDSTLAKPPKNCFCRFNFCKFHISHILFHKSQKWYFIQHGSSKYKISCSQAIHTCGLSCHSWTRS